MRRDKAQSSLEYLLTYSFAILILASAMAVLVQNRPDISVPSQCTISGPLNCVEHTNQGDTLNVLMQPNNAGTFKIKNATMSYRGDTSSNYCTLNVTNGGIGTSVLATGQDKVSVICDLSSLSDLANSFLPEKEEMGVEFRYKKTKNEFWKTAQIDIII